MTGALVVVGTPIGNLGDMSPRATEALAGADLICCEDTRRTGRLLAHLGITAERLKRVDEHTEYGACEEIVGLVRQGRTVAVVTDAGMPGVSDPGELLVAAVSEAGLRVTVVPGPSAVVSAWMICESASRERKFRRCRPEDRMTISPWLIAS